MIAALVFGFDEDKPDVFARTLHWAVESGVDVVNLNVLRPYPSSPLYSRFQQEGRLFHDPWWLQSFETRMQMVHGITANVSGAMTTFHPKQMSARQLTEGTLWVGQEFYNLRRTGVRLLRNMKSVPAIMVDALTNYFYAREYKSYVPVAPPVM